MNRVTKAIARLLNCATREALELDDSYKPTGISACVPLQQNGGHVEHVLNEPMVFVLQSFHNVRTEVRKQVDPRSRFMAALRSR